MPLQKKVGVNICVIGGASLLVLALCLCGKIQLTGLAITFVCLCVILILGKEKRSSTISLFPIAYFTAGAVNILGGILLSRILGTSYKDFYYTGGLRCMAQGCFPLLFIIFFPFVKGWHSDSEMVRFSGIRYVIVLLGMGCLTSVIALAQGTLLGQTNFEEHKEVIAVCLVIVGILFIGLTLWEVFTEKRALRYKRENMYYQLALKRQEFYIKEIVENDQKLRRFRHDVNAHLTALEQCIQTNDMQQLKSYVERMRAETRKYEVQQFTGVGAVDAVISEWHQKALEEGIVWEWDGGLLGKTEIETFDLCVIFSNLLSNAVEAVRKVEDGRERKIQVSCGAFRNRICIRISNTCRLDLDAKSNYCTTKSDFKNHGFGLMNIQNTVDKIHGEFHKNLDHGFFCAEVLL